LNFFRRKKDKKAAVQIVRNNNASNHPFAALEKYRPLSGYEIKLYSALKEAVPIIDAAISKIVRLVGNFKISCENSTVEAEINRFLTNVHVNACGFGAGSFLISHLSQLLTYGTAVGEVVLNSDGDSIKALYNASLDDVELQIGSSPLKLKVCLKKGNGSIVPVKNPELVLISSLNP
jgi:hypothetical protein